MSDAWSKIEAALMSLPGRKADYTIYPAVKNEILVIGCDPRAEGYLNPLPPGIRVFKYPAWSKDISLSVAAKQIKSLRKSRDLKTSYEKLGGLAITALTLNGANFQTSEKFSDTALNAVEKALALIDRIVKADPKLKSRRSGQPPKRVALRLAEILAEEYFLATDRAPAISVNPHTEGNLAFGPYFDLVKTTFDALNIQASPEAMGRKAVKHWKAEETGRGAGSWVKTALRGKGKKLD